MVRLSISASLIACLALAGLVNHATTCCCGDSLLVELIVESCGCDAHAYDLEQERHHPGPLGGTHACYKAGSKVFLEKPAGQLIPETSAVSWIWVPSGARVAPGLGDEGRPALAVTDAVPWPDSPGARLGRLLL
jgi:hypothetical protein